MPILFVIIVWMVTVMATVIANLMTENPIPEITDRCKSSEAKYRYYLRFVFDPKTKRNFNYSRHQITLRIHDSSNNYSNTLTVRTVLLSGVLSGKAGHDVRVIVSKNEKITDWAFVAIQISDTASFFIKKIEVMAIDSRERYLIRVGKEIVYSSPAGQYASNSFRCERKPWNEQTEEGRPPKQIQLDEMCIFFFMYINLLMFATALMLYYWTEPSDFTLYCVIPVSAAISINCLHTVFMLFYRFYIRQKLWKSFGDHYWRIVTDTFDYMAVLIGVVAGLGAAILFFYTDKSVNVSLYIAVGIYLVFRVVFAFLFWIVNCDIYETIKT